MSNKLELLRILNLPSFDGPIQLASQIRVAEKELFSVVQRTSKHYRVYDILKSNGSVRRISQPNALVKAMQYWVLRNILERLAVSPHATAYVVGRSLTDNISPHKKSRYFMCLDLSGFFEKITFCRIFHVFRVIGYSKRSAWYLAKLCTYNGSLPQGGVTSPYLSNLIAAKLDRRIAGFSRRKGLVYTRYSDDICVSAMNPSVLRTSFPYFQKIILSERFVLNELKTRVFGPRRSGKLTGLVKNSSEPGFSIGRDKERKIRAAIHRSVTRGSRRGEYTTNISLDSYLSFVKVVDPLKHQKLIGYRERLKAKQESKGDT